MEDSITYTRYTGDAVTTTHYRVTRDVEKHDPRNWIGRFVAKGETFDEYIGCTYGSCDTQNCVQLNNPLYDSFFDFPSDAVEVVS